MALDPDLVEYEQHVEVITGHPFDEITFFGLDPILVQQRKRFQVLVQTGRAVGWGKIPVAASPVFPTQLLDRPSTRVRQLDSIRWERTWSYVMAVADHYIPNHADLCAWPQAPVNFEPAPA